MAYCYRCGVELESGAANCPLCSTPVPADAVMAAQPGKPASTAYPDHVHDTAGAHALTKTERRRIALELVSISFILGASAVLLADMLFNGRLHWSLYALSSIGLVWIIVFSVLAFGKMPAFAFLAIPVSTVLYFLVLDWIDGPIGWSLTLAIPIALSLSLLTAIVAAGVKHTRRRGFNIVAYVFLGLASACVALESIIDFYVNGSVSPAWSIITGLVLVPLSGMLLFIHGRIMRGADLRKVFRL